MKPFGFISTCVTVPSRGSRRAWFAGTLSLTALVLLAGLWVVQPAAAGPTGEQGAEPQIQASLPELEDEVMCPICGTLLGMSRAPAAERQRVFMRRLIREGKSEEEIKNALVAEYGPQVLALPDDEDTNFWVYVVPVLGLILGALIALWAVLSWRRGRGSDGSGPGGAGTGGGRDATAVAGGPAGLSGEDAARLDRELDDYDR
jgi:cytochrome c-type biogenesis protein CcmH